MPGILLPWRDQRPPLLFVPSCTPLLLGCVGEWTTVVYTLPKRAMGSLSSYTPCQFLGVRGQAAKCKAEGISHCLVGRLVQSCMSSAALGAQADPTAGCNAHTGDWKQQFALL